MVYLLQLARFSAFMYLNITLPVFFEEQTRLFDMHGSMHTMVKTRVVHRLDDPIRYVS